MFRRITRTESCRRALMSRTIPDQTAHAAVRALPIASLTCDPDLQMRVRMDEDHIDRLCRAYQRGDPLPPITVVTDGTSLWVVDGHHRVAAAQRAAITELPCMLIDGSRMDALRYAAQANRTHGLPRSDLDIWYALERWLMQQQHDPTLNDAVIAQIVGVESALVRRVAGMLAICGVQPPANAAGGPPRGRPAGRPSLAAPPHLSEWRARDPAGWHAPGYVLEQSRLGHVTTPARNWLVAYAEAQRLDATVRAIAHAATDGPLAAPALIIGFQASPFAPPPLTPALIRHLTDDGWAIVESDSVLAALPLHRVRRPCTPLPPSLIEATVHYADALNRLADMIRRATRYDHALIAARAESAAVPNPLDELALMALSPDEPPTPADWYGLPTAPVVIQITAHTQTMVQARPWPMSGRGRAILFPHQDVYLAPPTLRDLILDCAAEVARAAAAWHAALDAVAPVWTVTPASPGARTHGAAPPMPAPTIPDSAVTAPAPADSAPDLPWTLTAPPTPEIPLPPSHARNGARHPHADEHGAESPDLAADGHWMRAALRHSQTMAHATRRSHPDHDRLVEIVAQHLLAMPSLATRFFALALALWQADPEQTRADLAAIESWSEADLARMGAQALIETLADALPDVQPIAWETFQRLLRMATGQGLDDPEKFGYNRGRD